PTIGSPHLGAVKCQGEKDATFCHSSTYHTSSRPFIFPYFKSLNITTSSAPIPSSWLHHYFGYCSFPESGPILHLPRTRPVSLTTSKNATQSFTSDADSLDPSKLNSKNRLPHRHGISQKNQQGFEVKESDEVENSLEKTCSELVPFSGLDKSSVKHEEDVEMMGDGVGSNGCSGHGSGWFSSNDGGDNTDSYYQKMIATNPNNALLLGNYAKFLKEVVADYDKAKEYLERAMLANPGDGILLCFYAELIWQTEKNADRAEQYYDQAVQIAPHDCYVLASYANFLWDAEEDEEAEEWNQKTDDEKHTRALTAASRLDPK
ncbi:uncharacterized protein LOC114747434, partial [Neltuma alba]|uniref:uncharacterized protein LOC114747434 n=1 Tax=Neltuma alba TaxID=207710 RepID=UPI0010A42839